MFKLFFIIILVASVTSTQLVVWTAEGELWSLSSSGQTTLLPTLNKQCQPPLCLTVWAKHTPNTDQNLIGIRMNPLFDRYNFIIYNVQKRKLIQNKPLTWVNPRGKFSGAICHDYHNDRILFIRQDHDYLRMSHSLKEDRLNKFYFYWLDYGKGNVQARLFANFSLSESEIGAPIVDVRDCILSQNQVVIDLVLWEEDYDQTYNGAAILLSDDLHACVPKFTYLPYSPQLNKNMPAVLQDGSYSLLTLISHSNESQLFALNRFEETISYEPWGPSLNLDGYRPITLSAYCGHTMYVIPTITKTFSLRWSAQEYLKVREDSSEKVSLSKEIVMPIFMTCLM